MPGLAQWTRSSSARHYKRLALDPEYPVLYPKGLHRGIVALPLILAQTD